MASSKSTQPEAQPAPDTAPIPVAPDGWAWAAHEGIEGAALLPLGSTWFETGGWQPIDTPDAGGTTTSTPTEE